MQPISKKHLVAMDPANPPMSGAGEALDQLMARVMRQKPFDAAVVAWDLVPAWNPHGDYCRRNETLDLYRFLARSESLPALWTAQAARRLAELEARPTPRDRTRPASPRGMVLALCMEPMFEAVLVQEEPGVKRALGLRGVSTKHWPRRWNDHNQRRPDATLLEPAVRAACSIKPRPGKLAGIRGTWQTNKDGWGEYLLRCLLEDEEARPAVLGHPVCQRLSEVGSRLGAPGR